jgi:DNA-binding CsgD family transcriptional regulator
VSELVGRRAEREAVEQLLTRARAGHRGALVVRGEAGIGTVLIDQAHEAAAASGFRVESSVGVEAEAQFAFAGLHQLCSPVLSRLAEVPDPQQGALGVAFGLRAGPPPDRFLVGQATLSLVAEVAEERVGQRQRHRLGARAGRALPSADQRRPGRRGARARSHRAAQQVPARLVATGATSREVATELFLSPRTIEARLRSISRKLGITSRRQLRELPLP